MPTGRTNDGDRSACRQPCGSELKIFLVATEESGDRLGAALMRALRQRAGAPVRFSGVGGREMTAAGLDSLLSDRRFLHHRLHRHSPAGCRGCAATCLQTVRAVLARRPHALVIIDSPSFTLWVARFVRMVRPLDSDRRLRLALGLGLAAGPRALDAAVSSITCWRCCRSSPRCIARLGGPPCSYVGHPLIEQVVEAAPERRRGASAGWPIRRSCCACRAAAAARCKRSPESSARRSALVRERVGPIEVVVPTVPHLLRRRSRRPPRRWPVQPRIVVEQAEKHAAFRVARAALAKSGTVTLELAVAGVPMVTAYKVSRARSLR